MGPTLQGRARAGRPAGATSALSHGERSLWFQHQLAPADGANNIAAAARIRSAVDAGALERAFQALVDRHPALRTTFPAADGVPSRQVAERLRLALARIDATGWSEETLRSRLADEAWRPFDLEHGPLLRVSLWTGGAGGPVLLLAIHHIVADFWSLAVLIRELPALYREAAGGELALLAPPGAAYEEHVRWEQEALVGDRAEALLAYWREALAGLPTLDLIPDRPRPPVQTYRGRSCHLRLSGELAAALRARSRRQRATLFMTLTAAFQALLGRHSGQEDLAVGAPRAGRSRSAFAGTVGYFVNPVVLRADLSGAPAFAELVERTRAAVLAAFDHGEVPLPLLAEHLQPVRDAGRAPLFQASFVMQKETRGAEGLTAFALGEEGVATGPDDLRLESLALERPPVAFDLMLQAVERQGGLSLALQSNADLFDAATGRRLLERFAVLLQEIAGGWERPLSALTMLPAAERHQLLCAWNDSAGPVGEGDLFARFAHQAERSPDRVAVVFGEQRLTYRELAGRATALAHHLARLGVGPEVRVGVTAERSAELIVGLLGVLGAGGAYLPLEPDLPAERLANIAADAGPAVLLASRAHAGRLPHAALPGAAVVWLEDAACLPWTEGARPPARPDAGTAAYVIYTSGSTGRPKGVVTSHRAILNRLLWMEETFGLDAGERFLHKTPLGFDVSVPELFAPLQVGGRLVVARPDGHRDGAYLAEVVQREGITTIHFVPSMLPLFLAEEGAAGCRSLRRVLVSGEAVPWEVEQRCLAVLRAPLINLYGPTEAAVEVTWWACQPAARPRPVPIGRPVRNTRIHLVGRRLEPVPAGAAGELAIAGVQVARGYLGRPDLTAERFVPDPFAPAPGGRLYRTGDLCRRLPGGEIEYLGRLDDQVKIRGFRIEPSEIEIALAGHPLVGEAAVVVLHPESAAERSLLACVVLREGEPGGAAAAVLREHLAGLLPAYMVPAFAFGSGLDRLPNGKLDRRALARWAPVSTAPRAARAPRTPVEELLAGLFADALGVERIGVEDGFFEHGGHSLAAMRLVARVRQTFGVDLPLHKVFEHPTVAALARAVEGAGRSAAPPLVALPEAARAGVPLPLSFAQQRLWLLDRLEPGSTAYSMPGALRIDGPLEPSVLEAAVREVIRRHAVLRTTFHEVDGAPVQVVSEEDRAPFLRVDLDGLPAAARERELLRLARAEARRPFDLAQGPLLRMVLARLGPAGHALFATLHHIVCDGWSLGLFSRELSALYATLLAGEPSPLPAPPIQYADFALWQRRQLAGEAFAAQLAWWTDRLRGLPTADHLPLARPRPRSHLRSGRGGRQTVALSAATVDALRSLGRRQGATLFFALLAGVDALLARYSGGTDLCVGIPVAGRTHLQSEGLIGCFLNTLAIRVGLAGDPSYQDLLGRVRAACLGAFAHQDVPFEQLLEELQPERELGSTPVFQVLFNQLDFGQPEEDSSALSRRFRSFEAVEPEPKLDLTIYAAQAEGGIQLVFHFDADLFDGPQMSRMGGHLAALLDAVAADPRLRLSEIPLEPRLADLAARPRADAGGSLAGAFLAVARQHGERPAVSAGGEVWTYRDLEGASQRLAAALVGALGPDLQPLALLLEGGPARALGVLGALRAGKFYVPLDPADPDDRHAFVLHDSGAAAVLADRPNLERARALAAGRVPVLAIDGPGSGRAPLPAVPPEAPAYVLYTSGSTGAPKGVLQSQGNVLRHIRAYAGALGIAPGDRLGLLASYSFDAAVMDLFGALLAGAALCPFDVKREGVAPLPRWLDEQGITIYHSTPTLFRLLLEALDERAAAPRPGVRLVVLGGEHALRQDLERCRRHFPAAVFVNGLGPTESTLALQFFARPGEELDGAGGAGIPVGSPVAGTAISLVNGTGEQVAVWGVGELVLRSDALAIGYLHRPELTAAAFVPDPASDPARPGGRAYRTGDLGRWRPDGSLEFVGRADLQVKVRGHRVELGEVEAALAALPGVRGAVVVARATDGGTALTAYLLARDGGVPAAADLRQALRRRLPDFMLPAAFVPVAAWPLTATGKIDRRALPEPVEALPEPAAEPPRTPLEELLCDLWAEVLGRPRAGAGENFFALGGHSLLATQLLSRVAGRLGIEVPLRALFEAPTPAALAERIEELLRGGRGPARPPLVPLPRGGALPLSFGEQRLWFLDRLRPDDAAYNLALAIRLAGGLDRPALAAALGEVVRRHEVLRSRYGAPEGEPVRTVAAAGPVPLPLVDLAGLPAAAAEGAARQLARSEAARPFDLAHGPLLRALLLRRGGREHIVLFMLHHIASDGWSLDVLAREVAALYDSGRRGAPSPLPELPVQYADYAGWQRGWFEAGGLDAGLARWCERLRGAPGALDLPADRPRPKVASGRGGSQPVAFTTAVAAALRRRAREEGSTLFMLLLAAYQTLLHRLSGAEDLTVGTAIAGRGRAELEGLIGLFANTLVLRGDLAGAPTFRELLRRTREAALEAHAHQEVPFEKVVEALQPQRDLAASPLFQVFFVLQNLARPEVRLEGLDLSVLALPTGSVKFDLSLTLAETAGGIAGTLEYAADLFDGATAARLAGHLETLAAAGAEAPDTPLSELAWLGAGERHQLLVEWADTAAGRTPALIHQLIAAQAARSPDAVAAVVGGGGAQLTYGELSARSRRLAARLVAAGAGPGRFVPLLLESGLDLVAALLGVLEAGAAFVPLDPDWPAARIAAVLESLAALGGPRLLLAAEAAPAGVGPEWRILPAGAAAGPPSDQAAPAVPSSPGDPIYAIYTSGSTGRPKGVVVPHAGIANRFRWMDGFFGLPAAARVLQTTRPVFDSAVWQILWPLTHGGTTVLTSASQATHPAELADLIAGHGITLADFVPALFDLFVERLAAGEARSSASLHAVIVGGEALEPAAARTFRTQAPGVRLVNLYGPTEASIGCIAHVVGSGRAGRGRVPIGRPIANTRARILDRLGRPQPVGVPGELCLAGDCLGTGYIGAGAATGGAFVPEPSAALPGERLYRTGDLARWLPDGRIDFLGRIDRQVKLRGLRIELGEIESALLEHAGVGAAVAAVREDRRGERRLVAWVVTAPGGPDARDLRAHLARRLPEAMVPSAVVPLAALPLTPGGKIDRGALPAPEDECPRGGLLAPRTPAEEVLAGIWCEVLGLPRVGVEESFFDLGGHSLLATQVMSRVRRLFGVELPLRTVFEAPTVAAMAEEVARARRAGEGVAAPPIMPVPRSAALPLSFAQQRLWFLDRLEPDSPAYNLPAALRVEGRLEVAALERALAQVMARHEVLRTRFGEAAGAPVQVIAPPGACRLPVVDFSALPAAAREAEAWRLATAEALRPFDLARGPLLRAALLRLGGEEHLALLTLHHIVTDGWSMRLLVEEVGALYGAALAGRPSPLPELPVQYADYAAWQRSWLTGEVLEQELSYWRRQLAGLPPLLELPTDRPRPAVRSSRGAVQLAAIPAELAADLAALGRREGATPFMVLLAAWQALLGRLAGSRDVPVGSPIAGRNREETERLIGFFVNTLVLRGDLGGDPGFRQLLGRVRQTALAAHEHQEVPFERLVDELAPERSLSRSPLFQVVFVLQNVPQRALDLPGVRLSPLEIETGTAKFDLTLALAERADGRLAARLESSRDLFDAATVRRLVGCYQVLLAAAAAEPARRFSDLPLLGAAEAHQLTVEWAGAGESFAAEPLHVLFERRAAAAPQAVAVSADGRSLTYAELDRDAGRLARALRALGVGPEAPVVLCLEPSPELVLAILAVLKAGATYVPCDPRHPAERLGFVLRDTGARLLLTGRGGTAALPPLTPAVRQVVVEDALADGSADDGAALPSADPAQLAYVIYTSGSTGVPKGVGVPHANVARLFASTESRFGFGPDDVWTLFHSPAFDFSVWEMWGALLYGGRLVIVPWEVSRAPAAFRELLVREGVTVLNQTPSAFVQLAAADAGAPPLAALRAVVFGGEALDLERLAPWLGRYGDRRPLLVNMYGITETTVHVTYRAIRRGDLGAGLSPIGGPLADLSLHLPDPALRPVPIGVAGEICVGGAGLARGYLGRPELTAERFVPDPFAAQPGSRLYRSGDLASRRSDGDVAYLGRIDLQVKIRGFRIELGEIEAVLASQEGVAAAVVAARGTGEERRLVAWVVPAPGREVDVQAVRAALRARLPDHMVPAAFVPLERLPLTANGKVDRAALPDAAPASAGLPYAPPLDPVQQALAEVWQELLQVERVGIHDNFFDLGGDSIRAVQLVSRINERLGAGVQVQDVFRHLTVAGLSEELRAGTTGRSPAEERQAGLERIAALRQEILADPRLRSRLPEDAEDFYPLSAVELGMVYHSLRLPDEPIYHDQYAYLLTLEEPERLFQAFDLVAGRHAIFRSSFHLHDFPQPIKVVHRRRPLARSVEDLSALPAEAQRERINEFKRQDLAAKYAFGAELPWRFQLFALGGGLCCAVLSCHHVILDGWSSMSLWVELNELCGRPDLAALAALPPLGSDYRDYVAIALGRESSPQTAAFWQGVLAGAARNQLPYNRTKLRRGEGMGIVRRRLPADLLAALRGRARELHVSPRALLAAAHAYLLHVTTGERDVVTGVVSHDRPALPDGERILGCFLNTVPLRVAIDPRRPASEWVQEVGRYLNAAREHEIPLVEIARLAGAKDASANPLFDTLFNFLDFHVAERIASGAEENVLFRAAADAALKARYDLGGNEMTNTLFDVEVSVTLGELVLRIKYSPRHFEAADVERAAALFEHIAAALADDPLAAIDPARLLSDAERREILERFNDTAVPYSRQTPMHRPFEEQARSHPERPAVLAAGRRLTYGELDYRAERLAASLWAAGARPGSNVGVIYERGVDLPVALLAVLKIGAAYVPLEPGYPPARKGYILRQAKVRWVLADRPYDLGTGDFAVTTLCPASDEPSAEPPARPAVSRRDPRPEDLAYTIFTSGSTGNPKGVMIEHHSATNLIEWVNRTYAVGPTDVLLMVSSVCFDLSVYDLFGGLAAGAAVVLATAEELHDPALLARRVGEAGVTFWSSTPATMGLLVDHCEQQGLRLPALRVVFLSGDWIPLALPDRITQVCPQARVISLGGATEGTVWSISYPVGALDEGWSSIPYGRPIANNTFYVVDRDLRPVPPGVAGELVIGGVGVARGYAGAPALTAAAFVPDPFRPDGRSRLYRTGDLGRMMRDGNLEFLGRRDHQVKVRGFRVELGEIESVLVRHPRVREAVVVNKVDGGGETYLCAYLVGDEPPAAAELRDFLGGFLPEYMIPAAFVVLPALPLSANGKVDRRALPDPSLDNLSTSTEWSAPAGEIETLLVGLWESVLGVRGIGTRHEFFELGGHSLSALQLLTRIRQAFGVELQVSQFFDDPTVAGNARWIAALLAARGEAGAVRPPLRPRARTGPARLSFAQERMWVLHRLDPGSAAFNISGALRLRGRLSLPAFAAAWGELRRRHEMLRSRVVEQDGGAVLVADGAPALRLPLIDLAGLPAARREPEARRRIDEALAQPFDLGRELLRAGLVRLAAGDHAAFFALHHIAGDGWSLGLLARELGDLYAGFAAGRPSPLAPLPVQYADFAAWQREWLEGGAMERQLDYWRRRLAPPLPVLALPGRRLRTLPPRFRGSAEPLAVPAGLRAGLEELARREGATLFMTLAAALQALLFLYTGEEDVLLGVNVANRDREEVRDVIGFFVNNVVLRTSLAGDPDFAGLLQRVRQGAFEAYAHQDVPYEKVIEAVAPRRRDGHAQLFQVMFIYQDFPNQTRQLPDLEVAPLGLPDRHARFDLTVMVNAGSAGLSGAVLYDLDLFDAAAMARFAGHFQTLLEQVAADPASRLSDLMLEDDDEAQELIRAFQDQEASGMAL